MKRAFASRARLRGGGHILPTAFIAAMVQVVSPPPRIVISGRARARDRSPKLCPRSRRRRLPQRDARRHDAGRYHAPQSDQ
jgi:hypothetical protein